MLVVHHPDQALHDPDTVFRTGKFITQPDRAERYRIFLDTVTDGRHEIVEAPLNRAEAVAGEHDPSGAFKVTGAGFAEAGRRLAAVGCPTLLVQEGGYLSPSFGGTLRSFLRAFERRT